jgi:hypothetical protein
MTELEWLKQESGMTDEDLKKFESVLGDASFKTMLTKVMAAKDAGAKAQSDAEQERLNLEKQWTDTYQPELRKITQEALEAKGEAARMKAALEAAREYGIVPPETKKEETPPRAAGSPDPSQFVSRDDFSKLQREAGTGLAVMNDLNAEHFKLFGSPVPNMQEMIDTVTRERTLGHSTDIRSVWEKAHNVAAKREEIKAAEQKKHDDEVSSRAIKEYAEKHGDNGNVRSGRPSRYSTYDPSKMQDGSKPWQRPPGMKRANNEGWRRDSIEKLERAASGRQ